MIYDEDIKKITIQQFYKCCDNIAALFCEKYNFNQWTWDWPGNEIRGKFGDGYYYVDLQTMIYCIEQENVISKKDFLDWYNYCIDAKMVNIQAPNLRNWLTGNPNKMKEEMNSLIYQSVNLA